MKQRWTQKELDEFWMLHPEELEFFKNRPAKAKLHFAFMLKYFKIFCRFPTDQDAIPNSIAAHLAKQIGVTETSFLKTNSFRDRLSKSHRQQIREFLGVRPSTAADIPFFVNWLLKQSCRKEGIRCLF